MSASDARTRDPLLMAAKVVIWFFTGVFALAAGIVTIGIPLVLFAQGRIIEAMAEEGIIADGGTIGAIVALFVAIIALLLLMLWFLTNLRHIVDSVSKGDPFAPVNADRLSRMGWIAIAGQLAAIPLVAMAMFLESTLGEGREDMEFNASFSIDGGGILLVIVLFILARVFRHGAAMREDLEGTV